MMPIVKRGRFFRVEGKSGYTGHKYYFDPSNLKSIKKAHNEALKQHQAIQTSKQRRKKEKKK